MYRLRIHRPGKPVELGNTHNKLLPAVDEARGIHMKDNAVMVQVIDDGGVVMAQYPRTTNHEREATEVTGRGS